MLSARFIQMVSHNWERIADRVIKRIRENRQVPEFEKYPDADLRERTRIILQNLGTWLSCGEADIALRYEQLGRLRFEEGVPLHVLVFALQTIRRSMIQYIRDEGLVSVALDIYAEEELEYTADEVFDTLVYHIVRGYEQAMRETPDKFGSAVRCRLLGEEPELPLPI